MAKGSIEKRGTNSWRLRVDLGYHPDGSRNRPSTTITVEDQELLKNTKKSQQMLEDYLQGQLLLFKQEVLSGNYIKPGKMTFSNFVKKEWSEKYAKDELSPTTFEKYVEHLNSRILPAFGHQQLDKISTIQIVSFIKNLQKPGARKDGKEGTLDIGTVQYIYRVIKNVLDCAEKWRFLSSNPIKGIDKPELTKDAQVAKARALKSKRNYYSEDEAQQVVDALYKESRKWRLLILGSMIGGFRRGEINGLEWPHVSFEESTFEIENTIPLTKKGKPIEKGPKTISSYRTVDMPEWYMNELEVYKEEWEKEKEELGDKWVGGDRQFVFHNGTGMPYYYKHPSRWWERFCKRHGIRYITFHGLRHSMGTLLIEDGDSTDKDALLKTIQERLGHAKKSTTEDVYVHLTKKVRKQTAGRFDKFARNIEIKESTTSPKLRRIK